MVVVQTIAPRRHTTPQRHVDVWPDRQATVSGSDPILFAPFATNTSSDTPALDGHHDATPKPTQSKIKLDMDRLVNLHRPGAANVHGVEAGDGVNNYCVPCTV
jgi:hypothetical protein